MRFESKDFRKTIQAFLFLLGILVFTGMFYYTWARFYNPYIFHPLFRGKFMLAAMYGGILAVCITIFKGHRIGEVRRMELCVAHILSLIMTAVIVYFPASLLQYTAFLPVLPLLCLLLIQALFSIVWNFFCEKLYFTLVPPVRLLLISDNSRGLQVSEKLTQMPRRYRLAASFPASVDDNEVLKTAADGMTVLLSVKDDAVRTHFARLCFRHDLQVYTVPTLSDLVLNNASGLTAIDTPLIATSGHRLTPEQRILKRLTDIVLSLLAIVISSPLWLIAAIGIKLCDGGPVFFRQNRLTENGRIFRIYKFRSMRVDAEKNGQRWASANDDRITPVGRIIRKFRIDELPQFLNVLLGDMSLVGPRPEVPVLAEEITKELPDFPARLKVKAGITGYAQVFGNYSTLPEDKLLMDIIYIERYSLVLDISLLLMTVKAIFITDKTEGVKEAK